MTSMTRPGTSMGAQKARGVLVGRDSMSRWTFSCARRSIPRHSSVASRAGTIRSAGKPESHSVARKSRGTSQRQAHPPPKKTAEGGDEEILRLAEQALTLARELFEREPEALIEIAIARGADARGCLAPRLGDPH